MIPKKVIDCIDEHLVKAETKHPCFLQRPHSETIEGETISRSPSRRRENSATSREAHTMSINEELNEIFEAVESGKIGSARERNLRFHRNAAPS